MFCIIHCIKWIVRVKMMWSENDSLEDFLNEYDSTQFINLDDQLFFMLTHLLYNVYDVFS